jgi:hypothetical protein
MPCPKWELPVPLQKYAETVCSLLMEACANIPFLFSIYHFFIRVFVRQTRVEMRKTRVLGHLAFGLLVSELHKWYQMNQLGHLDVNDTPCVHFGPQLDVLEPATLLKRINGLQNGPK